jgi:hypothetical protein
MRIRPRSVIAPGPGTSAVAPRAGLKGGATQKRLTSVASWGLPSARHSPADEPATSIVRTGPVPKAPIVLCRQAVNGSPLHCESSVQGAARHSPPSQSFCMLQLIPSWGPPLQVPANDGERERPQNPQKTESCERRSPEVIDTVPVVRRTDTGKLATNAEAGGGQSCVVPGSPSASGAAQRSP